VGKDSSRGEINSEKDMAFWLAMSMGMGFGVSNDMRKVFGDRVGSDTEEELTPEEKALLEARRKKYEEERTKGDRNLKAIEEARKKSGLPPLKFGKRSDEK
jgi:hypothetical protein